MVDIYVCKQTIAKTPQPNSDVQAVISGESRRLGCGDLRWGEAQWRTMLLLSGVTGVKLPPMEASLGL